MKAKKFLSFALAVAVAVGLAGWAGMATAGKSKTLRIGVLFPGDAPYLAGYKRGLNAAAKRRGVKLLIVVAGWKADVQANNMNDLIAQKPDGIIVWAVDQKAIVPSLAKADAADIPIVASNSEVDKSGLKYIKAYTGPNDFLEGQIAGKVMNKVLKNKGKTLVIEGVAGTAPQIRRLGGYKNTLAKGISILAAEPADWDKTKAINVTRDLLTKYGSQVKGIFGQDDTLAVGAAEAVKAAGMQGKIKIVGLGGSGAGLSAVKRGVIDATMLQSPVKDGEYAVDAIVNIAMGKPQPKVKYLPVPVITKKNVAKFKPEW